MKAALTLLTLACLAACPATASNVVVSNFSQAGHEEGILMDSNHQPLPVGSLVQLGSFPGKTPEEIAALANSGATDLMAALVPFGQPVAIGAGSTSSAGTLEFTASSALQAGITGLHVVVLNASSVEAATEWLVLKIKTPVPADDPSGLPGYLAVHLRDSELVFGSATTTGFATGTGVVEQGFTAWIAAQLGSGALPADLLPEADADGDGLSNLLEYAFGSSAKDGSSRAALELLKLGDSFAVEYLRRTDDSALTFACETEADPAAIEWTVLDTPISVVTDERPVPAGYERVRQALPSTGACLFARLRASN